MLASARGSETSRERSNTKPEHPPALLDLSGAARSERFAFGQAQDSMKNNLVKNNMLKEFYIPTYIFVPESPVEKVSQIPSCPVIVFINTKSGGQLGHDLIVTYRKLLNNSQVFDLLEEAPDKVLHKLYGNMERLMRDGDTVAAEIHRRLRLIVAGGDGTAGWLLGVVSDLKLVHPPPVATVPLGTGNNLPYSFGWVCERR